MTENVESFLGIESNVGLAQAAAPGPQPVQQSSFGIVRPAVESSHSPKAPATHSPTECFFLKTSNSRYVGMYSISEIQAGIDTGKFKSDWLATRTLDGNSQNEFHNEHQGPWLALSDLLLKPRLEGLAESPKVTPPFLPTQSDRGWPATSALRRWAMQAKETTVRASASEQAAVLCTLNAEDEVDFCGIESSGGKKWCKISLRSGQKGYFPGDTPIRELLYVQLEQSRAEMRQDPAAASNMLRQLTRGTSFLLLKTVKSEPGDWVKIRLGDGLEGFLDGKVKIKRIGVKSQNSSQHDMLVGGVFCIGGILVTAITYSAAAQSGGSYFVAWGAILFGGIQFLKGAFRAMGE
jgi:hypothetical protein